MARNSLGREIPERWHGRRLDPYRDPWSRKPDVDRATRPLVRRNPGESKLLSSLREAIEKCEPHDGMTIATHHHLRNGDVLLNLLVKELDALGIRDVRHRLQLGPPRARGVDPVHPQGGSHAHRDRGQRADRRTGEQGRAGVPDRGPKPRRARPVARHGRGGGRRGLYRGPMLRSDGQSQRHARPLGLRQPRLRVYRRALRAEGRCGYGQPGSLPGGARQHLAERRGLGGPDRHARRPQEDRLDDHAHHTRSGRPPDRPVRNGGHRRRRPPAGRLLVPDGVGRDLPGRGRQRQAEDGREEDQGKLRLRGHHRLLRGHARGRLFRHPVRRAMLRSARGGVHRAEPEPPRDQRRPVRQPVQSRVGGQHAGLRHPLGHRD